MSEVDFVLIRGSSSFRDDVEKAEKLAYCCVAEERNARRRRAVACQAVVCMACLPGTSIILWCQRSSVEPPLSIDFHASLA